MSLVDKLMAVDKNKFVKEETAEIKARHMSKLLGEETYIKVKGVSGDRVTEILSNLFDANGQRNMAKSLDSAALLVVEGIVEPNLKNKDLQEHFGAVTPKDLAKILFKGTELTKISDKILELSGFSNNDDEAIEEVKN